MNLKRVEQLLRQYARLRPPERLFAEETATRLRTRLAPSASASETETGKLSGASGLRIPAAAGASSRWRHRLVGAGTAAAAAVILVAVLVTAHQQTPVVPVLVVDAAYDKSDLFTATRSAPAAPDARSDSFYVGVRVDRPAYVRILVLDGRGRTESMALDTSGVVERQIDAGADTVFGAYDVESADDHGSVSRVRACVVLASIRRLSDLEITTWIEDRNRAVADQPAPRMLDIVAELERRFGCTVNLVTDF